MDPQTISPLLVYFEDRTIKTVGHPDEGTIGAHSIIFGDKTTPDFHGNWFTRKTFMGHTKGNHSVALLNHRVPMFKNGQFDEATTKALKRITDMRLKNPVIDQVDDVGVFSTLVLDLSDRYEKMVYDLAKKGVFKWSSGTAPQTFKALPSGELEMFIPVEKSLTPIPAEYRMLEHRVMPLKAYTAILENQDVISARAVNAFIKSYSRMGSFFESYD